MTLNDYYSSFLPEGENVKSIPLKSIKFSAKPSKPHSMNRMPKARSLAALAASAAASELKLIAGTSIPRRLFNPSGIIENGCASDILKSGIAELELVSGHEFFRLTKLGANAAIEILGEPLLDRRRLI